MHEAHVVLVGGQHLDRLAAAHRDLILLLGHVVTQDLRHRRRLRPNQQALTTPLLTHTHLAVSAPGGDHWGIKQPMVDCNNPWGVVTILGRVGTTFELAQFWRGRHEQSLVIGRGVISWGMEHSLGAGTNLGG